MVDTPAFDPFEVLGVGRDADEVTIQLAYRARIRKAHPDIAGKDGLGTAKQLNVARDWLLDPARRALLSNGHPDTPWPVRPGQARRGRTAPATTDLGRHAQQLREFLHTAATLSVDERARVNYALGDSPPPDLQRYQDYLEPELWARSRALRDEIERVWSRGLDEAPPHLPRLGRLLPTGFLVTNAYAQWILLGDFFRSALGDLTTHGVRVSEAMASKSLRPWRGSVGQPRYGPREAEVRDFLETARASSVAEAERLARSWREHLGRDGRGHPSEHIGPGVWLPSPRRLPDVLRISGYLAAVDATRVQPPTGLAERHRPGFHYGLRLTAHVVATGLSDLGGRDYMRPWRDAVGDEARYLGRPDRGRFAG